MHSGLRERIKNRPGATPIMVTATARVVDNEYIAIDCPRCGVAVKVDPPTRPYQVPPETPAQVAVESAPEPVAVEVAPAEDVVSEVEEVEQKENDV